MAALGAGAVLQPRTARSADNVPGANEQINVGIIGSGGMGTHNMRALMAVPGVHIAAVCDVAEFRLNNAVAATKDQKGGAARSVFDDYRTLSTTKPSTPCSRHARLWHFGRSVIRSPQASTLSAEADVLHARTGPRMVRVATPAKAHRPDRTQRAAAGSIQGKELVDRGKLAR